MPGLEEAAAAFDTAIGNRESNEPTEARERPTEAMFANVGDLEVDDNSPAQGGGDDLPNEGEVRGKKPKQPSEDRELTEDEILYGDDPSGDNPPKDSDEDEEPGEGEEEPEEGDEDEEELAAIDRDAMVEITVDGKPTRVKLGDALDGYIRQETFHQRMNQVNEARTEVMTAGQRVIGEYQKAVEMIDELGTALSSLVPKEPNWDEEYAKDPVRARKLQKDYDGLKAQLGELAQKRAAIVEQAQQTAAENRRQFAAAENLKIERNNPHWSDPKKKEKDLASMVRTARSVGFRDEEIADVLDSRMIQILLKASRYDRMMANRPKARIVEKKPAKPGTGATRTVHRGVRRSQQQLARTGSVEDAAAVMAKLL